MLEDGKTAPCTIKALGKSKRNKVQVMLHEGRKRQVRLMFQTIGIKVLSLHRKFYGPLNLGELRPGQSRLLLASEVQLLRKTISSNTKGKP